MKKKIFRWIIGIIWFIIAIKQVIGRNYGTAVLYALIGVIFIYFAFKSKQNGKVK